MSPTAVSVFLGIASIPFIYYLIALYSTWRFFRLSARRNAPNRSFTPPVSNVKPIRGLDPKRATHKAWPRMATGGAFGA